MHWQDDASQLSPVLRDRALERLGFSTPPAADFDGLRALYRAWCDHVPFDNIRKMIALRATDRCPLPGGQADDFFEHWLADGAGGTCWPSSNALFELARSLGFAAQRIRGCMRDLGVINHASVTIQVAGRRWLVDTSWLSNVPLPLDQNVFIHPDPVFAVEVEPVEDGNHLVWSATPPNSAYMPCRLLTDEVTHAFYLASYESSRERSPFNQRLYARRNRPGELLVLVGHTRFSKTAQGLSSRDLSPEEIQQALREDVGLSDRLVQDWVRSGSLDASFELPVGPKPPPLTGTPPSQR